MVLSGLRDLRIPFPPQIQSNPLQLCLHCSSRGLILATKAKSFAYPFLLQACQFQREVLRIPLGAYLALHSRPRPEFQACLRMGCWAYPVHSPTSFLGFMCTQQGPIALAAWCRHASMPPPWAWSFVLGLDADFTHPKEDGLLGRSLCLRSLSVKQG